MSKIGYWRLDGFLILYHDITFLLKSGEPPSRLPSYGLVVAGAQQHIHRSSSEPYWFLISITVSIHSDGRWSRHILYLIILSRGNNTCRSFHSAMANGPATIPGDEMDVDMDIDLGPIDVFAEGELVELVRGISSYSDASSVKRLNQLSRSLLSLPSPSSNSKVMAMARFCNQALVPRLR